MQWDGGVLNPNAFYFNLNVARYVVPNRPCIKRGLDDFDSVTLDADSHPKAARLAENAEHLNTLKAAFGGIHVGLANFAIGDGTVRTVSASINYQVLYGLGTVNDGDSVSLE